MERLTGNRGLGAVANAQLDALLLERGICPLCARPLAGVRSYPRGVVACNGRDRPSDQREHPFESWYVV